MKNVFLLGDSIRRGYQNKVKAKLEGKANVFFPSENGRFTAYTLNCLVPSIWLAGLPKLDIIHWNNGIWDSVIRFQEDGPFTPLDEYERNLRRILRELQKLAPRVIFATTTPPRQDTRVDRTGKIQSIEHIIARNDVALRVMNENDVEVNDLYSVIYKNREGYILDDLVHMNDEGYEALADTVVDCIGKYL